MFSTNCTRKSTAASSSLPCPPSPRDRSTTAFWRCFSLILSAGTDSEAYMCLKQDSYQKSHFPFSYLSACLYFSVLWVSPSLKETFMPQSYTASLIHFSGGFPDHSLCKLRTYAKKKSSLKLPQITSFLNINHYLVERVIGSLAFTFQDFQFYSSDSIILIYSLKLSYASSEYTVN